MPAAWARRDGWWSARWLGCITSAACVPGGSAAKSLPCASLVIDDRRNPHLGETASDLPPFESVYKRHLSRSILQVVKVSADAASLSVIIRATKVNFAGLGDPLALRVVFGDDRVTFEQTDAAAAQATALAHSMSAIEKVLQALAARDDASPQELAEITDLGVGTVRNKLTQLRGQGKVAPVRRGRWKATTSSSSPSPALGDNDGDDRARGGERRQLR